MFLSRLAVAACLSLFLAAPSPAAKGDCGQPVSNGNGPTASDCLFVLKAAVGTNQCLLCVCDTTGSNGIVASDSLLCLKKAVGQPVNLNCPACVTTTTTSTSSTSSTSTSSSSTTTTSTTLAPTTTVPPTTTTLPPTTSTSTTLSPTTTAAATCNGCGDVTRGADEADLCASSQDEYDAYEGCICTSECSKVCEGRCSGGALSGNCYDCIQESCGKESAACKADLSNSSMEMLPCDHCINAFNNGPTERLCPESDPIFAAVIDCFCGETCGTPCTGFCSGEMASVQCQQCAQSMCSQQINACFLDDGN